MEKIVELKNVSKVYKIGDNEFKALDNIDLSLNKGEMIVILGPSGAGKSTLLNLIGGMDVPTSGEVIVDGENISNYNENKLSDYRAENVGFIFQFYNILPSLTVKENVDIVKDIVKNPISTDEALKGVGLLKHSKKFPNQLSGGEQQRVSIARAIATHVSTLCPLSSPPINGMSLIASISRVGKTSLTIEVDTFLSPVKTSRKNIVPPAPTKFMTTPVSIVSDFKYKVENASNALTNAPIKTPINPPANKFPVHEQPNTPNNAANSIIPSKLI